MGGSSRHATVVPNGTHPYARVYVPASPGAPEAVLLGFSEGKNLRHLGRSG